MDFTFSPEQEALRAAVREFLAREASAAYVRAMLDDDRGFTDELWSKLVDLGWPGLLVPAADGGLGLGLVDAVVVQEELGKLPFPGPWLSSCILATLAAVRLGAGELARSLASGMARGTVALEELGHGDPVARIRTRATPASAAGEWLLDGLKPLVLDGHTADWAVVAARENDGSIGSFLLETPAADPVALLDVSRKAARLELSQQRARRIGPAGDHGELWRRVLDDAAVAVAAETLGAMERALEMAVEYGTARVQFGRPIASFQVIRHKAVDMLHRLELARVGTHYAAWASDVDAPERELAAAMCKSYVGEAATLVTADNIQIHGGVGFTWDVDAHLLFRRVKQNDLLFGSQSWQRQRLAALVLG